MINNVVLIGRLVKDSEMKYTPNGIAVCSFNLAVNRPFKNANGDNEADFFNIVCWRKLAENVANYTSKGMLVGVTGRLQSRSYENDQGKRVFIVEVVADNVQFLERKNDQSSNQGGNQGNNYGGNQGGNQGNNYGGNQGNKNGNKSNNYNPYGNDQFYGNPIEINDDDLPF